MEDGRTISVRSGQGRWITAVSVPHELSIKASGIGACAILESEDSHQGALEISGHARHLTSSPQDIEFRFREATISDLNVPDWRAAGYRVPTMVAGFLAYFAICVAWIAFVIGIVILKGHSALFFLIGALPPIYLITILIRLVNNAAVSSRTIFELGSVRSESIQHHKRSSKTYFQTLFGMLIIVGLYSVSLRLDLPVLARILILGISLIGVILLARRLRPENQSR